MNLRLEVSGLEPERGGRLLVLFFGPDGFPKDHDRALERAVFDFPSRGEGVALDFRTKLRGPVGIKVLHDDDGTGLTRKRWFFVPDKGIGYSRGARITWRVPRFAEAAVLLEDGVEYLRVPIAMQYILRPARLAEPATGVEFRRSV